MGLNQKIVCIWMLLTIMWLCPLIAEAEMQGIPRPEHPFPQMMRAEWANLNGVWQFAETDETADARYLGGEPYPDKITVPFCRESVLSGLGRLGFIKNVWYRRTFEAPSGWTSPRVRLHIGASDWYTRVWVNGSLVGEHKGGGAAFCFDITEKLKSGENTVIINAFDDTRSGLQATGKQAHSEESQGCVYTRTTGIWQTVWLEGVGSAFISDCRIEPDPDNSRVLLQADIDGPWDGLTMKAEAYADGKLVGTAERNAGWRNNWLVLDLSKKRLWSPKDPFLYDLKLTLMREGKVVDKVDSYFGLRKISIQGAAILINDEPIFQRTVLDQGFYPDGIWTAPTDEALKHDIEMGQACGFNGARMHEKIFEPRYMYWADKMGYMIWGEFPNWGLDYANPAIDKPVINEWAEIVRRDRNHPSLVGWCPFNETPEDCVPIQNVVVNLTRLLDPSRPVIDSSGWSHGLPDPEVLDAHDYDQNPETFRTRWMNAINRDSNILERYRKGQKTRLVPFFVSEYGGIGWDTGGGWGYGNPPKTLEEFYVRYEGLTNALLDNRYMFGFSYTQLTDVEQEKNGLYTYDRKPKFDVERIRKITSRTAAYELDPPLKLRPAEEPDLDVLIGAFPDLDESRQWRYTFDRPSDNWNKLDYDDSTWKLGMGGFGAKDGWNRAVRTPWRSKDIWLRQEFDYNSGKINEAKLIIHHDDDAEVFVNGVLVWSEEDWNDTYDGFDVTETLSKAIKPGRNVIAVHVKQEKGGQFIDLALLAKTAD